MAKRQEKNPSERTIKRASYSSIDGGEDIISSMPNEILHHIFSFIPTNLAVKTSCLSRRWRHVWCETPCLYFDGCETTSTRINETLKSYRALKITSFHVDNVYDVTAPEINSWIEFAMSRNVEKLSVYFRDYTCPDFVFLSSSLEQLYVSYALIPRCQVSWKLLRYLSLRSCIFSDEESLANILTGCPILETLELIYCRVLPPRIDLSKSMTLRRLEISGKFCSSGPMEIIAPHIHYLRLRSSEKLYTLVDVSSLTEASLDISSSAVLLSTVYLLQEMLEKLQNVERLTFGRTLFQILSLAAHNDFTFPTLKVRTLIVETMVVQSAIPGVTRLLQNSPRLKKLIVHAKYEGSNIEKRHLDNYYLDLQGLNPDQCWRTIKHFPTLVDSLSKNATSELYASFMELVLRNSKTLETLVVHFKTTDTPPLAFKCFEKLLQRPPTLSHNNNVSIALNPSNYTLTASMSLS